MDIHHTICSCGRFCLKHNKQSSGGLLYCTVLYCWSHYYSPHMISDDFVLSIAEHWQRTKLSLTSPPTNTTLDRKFMVLCNTVVNYVTNIRTCKYIPKRVLCQITVVHWPLLSADHQAIFIDAHVGVSASFKY